jgi:hypothetical protein
MPNLAYKKYLATWLTYEDQLAYEQIQRKRRSKFVGSDNE